MRIKMLFVSILLLSVLALGACAPTVVTSGAQPMERTLGVTGTGQVYITPDLAYVSIGVRTEALNLTEAVAANNSQATQLIAALKQAGVDEKDIRTANFSIWLLDRYDPSSGAPTGERYYAVENTVYVTVRNLERLGALLDTAIAAGANTITGVQFDLADKSEAMRQARAAAVKSATDQAKELAGLANVELVEILSISYLESTPYVYAEAGRGGAGMSAQAAVPIQPGQMTITATVSVIYRVR